MKELIGSIKDSYNRRARLQAALVVALPLGLAVLSWSPDGLMSWNVLWSLLVSAGGTALMTQLARDRGVRKEKSLFASWDGTPTTRLLRHAGNENPVLLARRHRLMQASLPDVHFPSSSEEPLDPAGSDHVYATATTWLRSKTRNPRDFPLVFEENCNYGFRRNLWGMR